MCYNCMMERQLILTACIVNFGLTSVQPFNETLDQAITSKVKEERKISENFQNLFNSIVKNNIEKSEIYQRILQKESAKEQETFDSMKKELHVVQNRNAYKKRNLFTNGDVGQTIVPVKRAIVNEDVSDESDEPRDDAYHNSRTFEGAKQRKRMKAGQVHREDCYRMLIFSTEGVTMSNVVGLIDVNTLAPGGIESETETLFQNAKKVLEHNASALDQVYSVEIKLANKNDTQIVDNIFRKYFKEPYPKKSIKQATKTLALNARIEADISATMTMEQLFRNPDADDKQFI